jgi:hypothetical protein
MLMIPHFLENWLADGSEYVSLMRWPRFSTQKEFLVPFLLVAESTTGP